MFIFFVHSGGKLAVIKFSASSGSQKVSAFINHCDSFVDSSMELMLGLRANQMYQRNYTKPKFISCCLSMNMSADLRPLTRVTSNPCVTSDRSSPAPRPDCTLGPRDQINQITSYLDASNVYGSSDEEMNQLRLFSGGASTLTRCIVLYCIVLYCR